MTKHEIIDLIANTYNLNTRATKEVAGGGCHYLIDGKMCAVGMTLTDPERWEKNASNLDICEYSYVADLFKDNFKLWEEQKEEFRGHSLEFWSSIQELHDTEAFWNDKGLSGSGSKQVELLKGIYE